ncbi:Hypothetical predicted protein [Podarcis lilfordi]|uniref:Uncharacterized protein n=1 Tax=Podarcis lilfordi TaxID=74358 RepID=A0AA35K8X3_9SAUR|nr:Hypothetical predicted protein [Podarcis lilfordi]
MEVVLATNGKRMNWAGGFECMRISTFSNFMLSHKAVGRSFRRNRVFEVWKNSMPALQRGEDASSVAAPSVAQTSSKAVWTKHRESDALEKQTRGRFVGSCAPLGLLLDYSHLIVPS